MEGLRRKENWAYKGFKFPRSRNPTKAVHGQVLTNDANWLEPIFTGCSLELSLVTSTQSRLWGVGAPSSAIKGNKSSSCESEDHRDTCAAAYFSGFSNRRGDAQVSMSRSYDSICKCVVVAYDIIYLMPNTKTCRSGQEVDYLNSNTATELRPAMSSKVTLNHARTTDGTRTHGPQPLPNASEKETRNATFAYPSSTVPILHRDGESDFSLLILILHLCLVLGMG